MTLLPIVSSGVPIFRPFVRRAGRAAVLPSLLEVLPPVGTEPEVFLLDRDDVRNATFLLTGDVLESDRHLPVSSLRVRGIHAVMAPGFGPVFYEECVSHGVLPLGLGDDELEAVAAWILAHPLTDMAIDLDKSAIECPGMDPLSFTVEPRLRNKLLLGLDDLKEMLQHEERGRAFRSEHRQRMSWLYASENDEG